MSRRGRRMVYEALVGACLVLLVAEFSQARGEVTLDKVGPHYPIFRVEKNENPQNILIAYTKLDSDCRLVSDIDYYWLMDRQNYKPVHPLIKSGIRGRLHANKIKGPQAEEIVQLRDLKELDHDLGSPALKVVGKKDGKGCDVTSTIQLGPSDSDRTLRLESIDTESRKTFWPPFRKVVAVTLNGVDTKTGEDIHRKYQAK